MEILEFFGEFEDQFEVRSDASRRILQERDHLRGAERPNKQK
jgi:hypothetical protein